MDKASRLREPAACQFHTGSPQVYSAGGWNIIHHCGVARALRDHGLLANASRRLGCSAGALFLTFIENGYEPEKIYKICMELKAEGDDPRNSLIGLRIPNPASIWMDIIEFWQLLSSGQIQNPWEAASRFQTPDVLSMVIGGLFTLRPHFARLVYKYSLKPTAKMMIVACDLFSREPVLFSMDEGNLDTQEDLINALTAAGSPPGICQPVWYWDKKADRLRLLTDGAMYHYSPTEFFNEPCVVSKFRRATRLPAMDWKDFFQWKSWFYLYVSFREVHFPLAGNNRYVDPFRHLVIENGKEDVAALNGGISDETCRIMEETAYNVANETIKAAKAQGRICTMD